MTEDQACVELFGDLVTRSDYTGRCEPIAGREFVTFAGIAQKAVGESAVESGIQPTEAEAMRVHVEALKFWLDDWMCRVKRPVVCVRAWPHAEQLSDGRWLAYTRLLVTEGARDVPKPHLGAKTGQWLDEAPLAVIRGLVMGEQPVVGVIQ